MLPYLALISCHGRLAPPTAPVEVQSPVSHRQRRWAFGRTSLENLGNFGETSVPWSHRPGLGCTPLEETNDWAKKNMDHPSTWKGALLGRWELRFGWHLAGEDHHHQFLCNSHRPCQQPLGADRATAALAAHVAVWIVWFSLLCDMEFLATHPLRVIVHAAEPGISLPRLPNHWRKGASA
jgi:hypothetical protein